MGLQDVQVRRQQEVAGCAAQVARVPNGLVPQALKSAPPVPATLGCVKRLVL